MIVSLTGWRGYLMEEEFFAQALPVICLNEWVNAYVCFDVDGLTRQGCRGLRPAWAAGSWPRA